MILCNRQKISEEQGPRADAVYLGIVNFWLSAQMQHTLP